MLTIRYHRSFKKDFKLAKKRGYDIKRLENIIYLLANRESLPKANKDHFLTGNYEGCRECHIMPDWLLIYEINENDLILHLLRNGTHSDLF